MKALYFLAVTTLAAFYGTWAQVIPGGRVCIGVTHDSNSGSTTTHTTLSLCDDATSDHWTSLGPVFPFSATLRAPPTATESSALESSSSIIQGTAVHSPSWSLTSPTEQTSSIKTYYTFTSNGETPSGPDDSSTSLASSFSLSETLSGAPSASLASSISVRSSTAPAVSSTTTPTRDFSNTSSTTTAILATSKSSESIPSPHSATTTLSSSKAVQIPTAVADSTTLFAAFIPTSVQPMITSSNSSTSQSRVPSAPSDGLLASASPDMANSTLPKVGASSTLGNLTITASKSSSSQSLVPKTSSNVLPMTPPHTVTNSTLSPTAFVSSSSRIVNSTITTIRKSSTEIFSPNTSRNESMASSSSALSSITSSEMRSVPSNSALTHGTATWSNSSSTQSFTTRASSDRLRTSSSSVLSSTRLSEMSSLSLNTTPTHLTFSGNKTRLQSHKAPFRRSPVMDQRTLRLQMYLPRHQLKRNRLP